MKSALRAILSIWLLTLGAGLQPLEADPGNRPNFSGTWRADLTKSRFVAGSPQPKNWTVVIQHDGQTIVRTENFVGLDNKRSGMKTTFTTDGKENHNHLGGTELITKCRWEGTSLIIQGTMMFGPKEPGFWTEKFTLSPDGKVLHSTSTVRFQGNQTNDTDIYLIRSESK